MYLLIIFIHLLILSVGAVGSNGTDGGDGNDKLDICLISYYQNLYIYIWILINIKI